MQTASRETTKEAPRFRPVFLFEGPGPFCRFHERGADSDDDLWPGLTQLMNKQLRPVVVDITKMLQELDGIYSEQEYLAAHSRVEEEMKVKGNAFNETFKNEFEGLKKPEGQTEDYRDSFTGDLKWSIGRALESDQIHASISVRISVEGKPIPQPERFMGSTQARAIPKEKRTRVAVYTCARNYEFFRQYRRIEDYLLVADNDSNILSEGTDNISEPGSSSRGTDPKFSDVSAPPSEEETVLGFSGTSGT